MEDQKQQQEGTIIEQRTIKITVSATIGPEGEVASITVQSGQNVKLYAAKQVLLVGAHLVDAIGDALNEVVTETRKEALRRRAESQPQPSSEQ